MDTASHEIDEALAAWDAEPQVRSAHFKPIDVADDGSWFEGYAAVFDEIAELTIPGVGLVTEEVRRGAFRRVLSEQREPIPMLYHHLDVHPPLATTTSGTLQLEEDAKGLRTRADIAKGYIGDTVRELVRRGDIPGMSWGFIAGKDNSKVERRGASFHRALTGFKKILDVSPTWDPTYRGTMAEVRSRSFGTTFSAELAQQVLAGDVQQSEDEGADLTDEQEEARDGSGAIFIPSIAARKRALDLLIAKEGGM